jgi:hypothetical protein
MDYATLAAEKAAAAAKGAGLPEGALLNTGDERGFSQLTDKSLLAKTVEKKDGAEKYIAINREMLELKKKHGDSWDTWSKSEGAALLNSLATDAAVAYAMMNGQGAMAEGEAKTYYENKVGKGSLYAFGRNSEAILNQNVRTAEQNYNRYMQTVAPGFKGGYQFVLTDEGGKWQRRATSFKPDDVVGVRASGEASARVQEDGTLRTQQDEQDRVAESLSDGRTRGFR